jgi:exodeoxyribonuclease VII small subunit
VARLYGRVRAGVNRGRLSCAPVAFKADACLLSCVATFNVARVKSKPEQTNGVPDFEQSLAELETLVARLEQGDVPLEDALKTFERGVALTRQCQTALRTAQQKVEVLLARDGAEKLAPFDERADEDEDDGR